MKRKVVRHGSATLTISLPSKWVRKYGIKPGDELSIDEELGKLVLSTDKSVETVREAAIITGEYGLLAGRALCALYKGGCDSIAISLKYPDEIGKLEELMPQLVGFEIMQQSERSVVIKEVSHPAHDVQLDDMIKRTFLLLMSVASDFADNVRKEGGNDVLRNLINRDISVNKFCNLCRRILMKRGMTSINDAPMIYCVVEELENIGDVYKYLAKYILENNVRIKNQEIHEVVRQTNKLLSDFFRLYFKFGKQNAVLCAEDAKRNLARINSLFNTKVVSDIRVLDYLTQINGSIAKLLGPLLTMKVPGLSCPEYAAPQEIMDN
ncbi:phosphate uptake regulator PhoU [Candidatus Woesearchaeota archaeon]|nr:phosphate uptake regulator PhoU [Candidatus Woesearchaeota archaeon]